MANESTSIPRVKLIEGANGRNLTDLLGLSNESRVGIEAMVTVMVISSYNPAQEMIDEGANHGIAEVITYMSTFCGTQAEFAYACFYIGTLTMKPTDN